MTVVLITAAGVGGATVIGALLGFLFKNIPHKFNDSILGFAAGIMLCAAVVGLILPSIEYGGDNGVWTTAAGVITGAVFLNFADRFIPHLHKIVGIDIEEHKNTQNIDKVMLFVMAIAIHNLPEGIAAGVSFGTGDIGDAIAVSTGIVLQNIPEGMVIIAPLLTTGIGRRKTFWIAAFTGLIEVVGTFIGYFAITLSKAMLPFALAFAGGTMLYVISDEMIPETHSHGYERISTYSLIIGFIIMLMMSFYIG
ncbi:MAG: ZIP family metal transporter [Oscillospiraceae bacterium]|jgi:ZIP family zinc transporter|nr:ZIP family metal transporter [Oscillospiraceae bacterium]